MVLLFGDFVPSLCFHVLVFFLPSLFFFKSIFSHPLFTSFCTNIHKHSFLVFSTPFDSNILYSLPICQSVCLPLTHIHIHTLTHSHSRSNTVKRETRIEWQFQFSLLSLSLFFSLKKECSGPKPVCINKPIWASSEKGI